MGSGPVIVGEGTVNLPPAGHASPRRGTSSPPRSGARHLYPPGVTWDEDQPPDPAFWMHQLPADSGADRDLVLYPSRFAQELLRLLGDGVEPSHTSRADLGLQLHWEGLLNMTRKRGEYAIEDVREAFEDSKTVRGV